MVEINRKFQFNDCCNTFSSSSRGVTVKTTVMWQKRRTRRGTWLVIFIIGNNDSDQRCHNWPRAADVWG